MPLALLALAISAFAFTAHSKIGAALTLFVLGVAGFATVPPLQSRVMQQAQGATTLASAANIGAFNVGNALGPWLAGMAIEAHWGYTSPNWVGAALAASGLAVALASGLLERRTAADRRRPATELVGSRS